MTYNIRTGAVDRGGADRLDAIAQVVRRESPDVLALQELRGFRRGGARVRQLCDALGMAAFLAPSWWWGQPVGVLVRPPVRARATRASRWGLHHAAAAVVLDTDRGSLTVVAVHLNPFSGGRRRREAGRIAARFAGPGAPVLVLGDLNSLDPDSAHDERLARLPQPYRRRHLRRAGGGEPVPDTRAVAALTSAGLLDLWRVAGSGERETTAPTSRGGGAEFSGMRLDYILASADVAATARDCRVVTGDESEYASDHYPVVVDLDLKLR